MSTKDLRQFFSQFSNSLQVLARDGRHVELKVKLDALSELLDAWLDVAPSCSERPQRSRLFSQFDRFNGPLDVDTRDLAEQGVLSGDTTTLQVLADGFARFAFRCIHREQFSLAQEYLDSLVFLFYRCRDNDAALDAVGTRLDSILNALLTGVTYPDERLSAEPDDKTYTVFRFALALVNAAIRLRQSRDAVYFVDRLLKVREYQGKHDGQFEADTQLTLSTNVLLDFVIVLLIGWSLEVIQEAKTGYHPAAQEVLQALMVALPSRELLMAEWEMLHDNDVRDSRIGGQLGVSNWDVSDWDREIRSGIITTGWGGRDWSKTGLRAALLLTTEYSWQDVDALCGGSANRFTWDVNAERDALQKLAEKEVLSIPDVDREARVEQVLTLIAIRSRGGDAQYLRYVLETPLSTVRKRSFEDQAIASWAKHRAWIDAARDLGFAAGFPKLIPLAVEQGVWVPREYFLQENNWGPGFGDHLGEIVGKRECVNLLGELEQIAPSGENVETLATLPDLIRRAVRAMVDGGYSVNCIVLPREDRFAGALFRKPLWQVEDRRHFGQASIGDWEGLHVLRCPYTDPKGILLIDTTRAFAGTPGADRDSVTITIDENPDNLDAKTKLELARSALKDESVDIPKSSDVLVLARMKIEPVFGIVDTEAAIKLSIENSDGGFAMTENSDLYHRPSCPDIAFDDVNYVLHEPKRGGRKPCPTCRPEKWNSEGRRGRVDPESNSDDS